MIAEALALVAIITLVIIADVIGGILGDNE